MRLKQIVFATDFSEPAGSALDCATTLARAGGGRLIICHVTHLESQPVGELFEDEDTPSAPPGALSKLHEVQPADPVVEREHHLLHAKSPHEAEEIIRFAREKGADMIVVGTHGRTGLARMVMGSVAENLVRHAACPVLIVPCHGDQRSD